MSVDNAFLRLINDGVNNQNNEIVFDRVSTGGASTDMGANFDLRFINQTVGQSAADGMALLFLPTDTYGNSGDGAAPIAWEEPNVANTFAIGFDLWQNENDVSAHWNGVEIQNADVDPAQIDLDAGGWINADVHAEVVPGGSNVTVTLNQGATSITPINNLFVPGFLPYDYRVEFAGRTGGANVTADLDNIVSTQSASPAGDWVSQNFDGGGTQFEAENIGAGSKPRLVTEGGNNFLRLMHAENNQNPSVAFEQVMQTTNPQFSMDFRMNADAAPPAQSRADGFGIALLDVATYGTGNDAPHNGGPFVWELNPGSSGLADAFTVGVDIWDNGGESGNTIRLNYDGTPLGQTDAPFLVNNDVFNNIEFMLEQDGTDSLASLWLTDGLTGTRSLLFDQVAVPGLDLAEFDFRLAVGGRTGGASTNLDLDNIRLVPEPSRALLVVFGFAAMLLRRRR
ncbi:MAG: PEP-CTERM sorting domain-containing protein [Verrucomicrobiales bacterium]